MENDLISIVVPVYNGEKTLYKTIYSIVNQSYKNIEIIIINDGSIDNTEEECKKLLEVDDRIKYFFKENNGQASARNEGIKKSTGNYLLFIDSDDIIEENMIELLYNSIISNNSEVCICGITFDYLNQQYSIKKEFKKNIFAKDNNCKAIIEESIINGMLYSPCNKIYVKDIILNNKIFFNIGLEPIEDILFNCEYFKNVKNISVITEAPYHYIKIDNNSTVTKYNKNLWNLSIKRSNAIKSLFEHYNMNIDKYKILLYQEYIGGKSDCVINCYRKEANLSFNEKLNLLNKYIFKDDYLKSIITDINIKNLYFDQKILIYCLKLKSPLCMIFIYNLLFFIKNNLKEFYFEFRKKTSLRN